MEYREELIDCPDGRVLEIATLGDPSGHTVLFHHGTPGSIKTFRAFEGLLERGNFYFVTASRAGYGASTRREGRNVASVIDDARTVLDYLARDSYTVMGWSGGGPHALACGALDAPRCQNVVALASLVPFDSDVDWTEGMGPENLEEFDLAKEGGAPYEEYMKATGLAMAQVTTDNAIEMMSGLLPDADRDVLSDPEALEIFVNGMRYGFAKSWHGYFDDNVAFMKPWGFNPATIEVPVAVYYGDADLMVPPVHGQWLVSNLPTATSHHHPSEGHLSVYLRHLDEITADLLSTIES
jgi:pimeloyl-ACP methyl ester carboxylesterase